MTDNPGAIQTQQKPAFLIVLGWFAILGCAVFAVAVLIADFVVPDHDWIADTISDLGAGKYEFIVDIGIYTFSAALISIAVLAAHTHMDGTRWSVVIAGFIVLGLIVFLIGARNEYGDSDDDGAVIHIYLVYALGLIMALLPWCMAEGARRAGAVYGHILVGASCLWVVSAPVFFYLPDAIDGVYERYLGLITFVVVITLARIFIMQGRRLQGGD